MACPFCSNEYELVECDYSGVGFCLTRSLLPPIHPITGEEQDFNYCHRWLKILVPVMDKDLLPINYCPFCGEDLTNSVEVEKGERFLDNIFLPKKSDNMQQE